MVPDFSDNHSGFKIKNGAPEHRVGNENWKVPAGKEGEELERNASMVFAKKTVSLDDASLALKEENKRAARRNDMALASNA